MALTHSATPSEPEDRGRHFTAYTVFIFILACFGTISFAYSGGVIGSTIGQPSFIEYMGLDTNPNASALLGAATSLYYAGGFFGALFSNWISDRFGRKVAIGSGVLLILLSSALTAGSVNIAMFIVFRCMCGWGALMVSMSVPLWIMECAPPNVRGAFAQFHGVGVNIGYLVASYVGIGFFYDKDGGNAMWRGPLAIGCVPCLVLLVGLWWLPESPRYLLMKGRDDDAWKVMGKLHSTTNAKENEYVQKEMFQMTRQIELDRTLPSSWLEIFRRPSYRKRMGMAIFVVFAINSSGSQIIGIYSTTLFEQLGFNPSTQLFLFAGLWSCNLLFTTSCIFYTEKFRRPTMISFGLCILLATTICYTALSATYINSTNRAGKIAAVSMTYIFLAAYSGSVEGPFYYYGAEFFPTHLRAKGMALQATTFSWSSIMWAQSGSTGLKNIGWKYFIVFIIITFFSIIIIYFWFPDTKGRSLEEVAALFGDEDLVVVYQRDIHIDAENHKIVANVNNVPGTEGKETVVKELPVEIIENSRH
ncbi:hypothetical protein OIDMADRAFT_60456 [Oidiodendron maius Zn]|uniref:Major facilitator superfamily (MFS) profile domain-containing protein n=1 Tax=Oidiodendron maius (strain Zn) TaxID=913774 RepID=A0A0C3GTR9_OIDMZ|nr:hypothetical protein OIDMADRAFT_60456 [Oidiodendron maius Zn]